MLTSRDKRAIADITREFDIDFVALTYTCSADDVIELRQYLESLRRESIRIIAKVPTSLKSWNVLNTLRTSC